MEPLRKQKIGLAIILIVLGVSVLLGYSLLRKIKEPAPSATMTVRADDEGSDLQSAYDSTVAKLDGLTAEREEFSSALNTPFINYELPALSEDSTKAIQEIKSWRSCTVNEPRPLSTLNSGSNKFFSLIDKHNSYCLSLFGLADLKLGKNEMVGVLDYVEYKDTICTPGEGERTNASIRLAAGVRLTLMITGTNTKIKFETPTQIAAAMELDLARVKYSITTIGFKTEATREILADIEEQGEFNVKSYIKVIDAVNKIMATMNDRMMVNPEKIPVSR